MTWFKVTGTQEVPLKNSRLPLEARAVILTSAGESVLSSEYEPKSLRERRTAVSSGVVTESLVERGASLTGVTVIVSVEFSQPPLPSMTV